MAVHTFFLRFVSIVVSVTLIGVEIRPAFAVRRATQRRSGIQRLDPAHEDESRKSVKAELLDPSAQAVENKKSVDDTAPSKDASVQGADVNDIAGDSNTSLGSKTAPEPDKPVETIVLRNGDILRAVVLKRVQGAYLDVRVVGGTVDRRISWEELEDAEKGDESESDPALREVVPRTGEDSTIVHLETIGASSTPFSLELVGVTKYKETRELVEVAGKQDEYETVKTKTSMVETICTEPCQTPISLNRYYGYFIVYTPWFGSSRRFRFPSQVLHLKHDAKKVSIRFQPPKARLRSFGWGLFSAGAAAVVLGFLIPWYRGSEHMATGASIAGAGAGVSLGSIFLLRHTRGRLFIDYVSK